VSDLDLYFALIIGFWHLNYVEVPKMLHFRLVLQHLALCVPFQLEQHLQKHLVILILVDIYWHFGAPSKQRAINYIINMFPCAYRTLKPPNLSPLNMFRRTYFVLSNCSTIHSQITEPAPQAAPRFLSFADNSKSPRAWSARLVWIANTLSRQYVGLENI
jgi:hypothetical protein